MNLNALYYGDNLDILRRYLKDDTVDLIYLDPPFKSNQDYNVLFAEQDGSRAAATIRLLLAHATNYHGPWESRSDLHNGERTRSKKMLLQTRCKWAGSGTGVNGENQRIGACCWSREIASPTRIVCYSLSAVEFR